MVASVYLRIVNTSKASFPASFGLPVTGGVQPGKSNRHHAAQRCCDWTLSRLWLLRLYRQPRERDAGE